MTMLTDEFVMPLLERGSSTLVAHADIELNIGMEQVKQLILRATRLEMLNLLTDGSTPR